MRQGITTSSATYESKHRAKWIVSLWSLLLLVLMPLMASAGSISTQYTSCEDDIFFDWYDFEFTCTAECEGSANGAEVRTLGSNCDPGACAATRDWDVTPEWIEENCANVREITVIRLSTPASSASLGNSEHGLQTVD